MFFAWLSAGQKLVWCGGKMRLLALDWGEKRIGAAISDEGQTIAFPLEEFFDPTTAVEEIKNLIAKDSIEKVLIGNPLMLSGQKGPAAKKVQLFAEKLKKETDIEVEFIDERFSTVAAQKILALEGLNEKKQRALRDNLSSQLILQAYLDAKQKSKP